MRGGFRDLALRKSFVKFSMCSYEKAGWPAFSKQDFGKWARNENRDENGMHSCSPVGIASHCLRYFPHHKHPIWLQWYSFTSCQIYDGVKSHHFCVSPCLLCFSNFAPELVPGSLAFFFSSRNLAWIFSYEPKEILVPVTGPAFSTRLMWSGLKYFRVAGGLV